MKTIEVVESKTNTTRLTIAPDRITVKVAKEMTALRRKQLLAFVDYVVEQFVVLDKVWRGIVKFEHDGVTLAKVSLASDNPRESNRRYECAV